MLSGEEPYFIDIISDYIEENILTEEEKGFNQSVLYGRDTDAKMIADYARRYPMMASHQVVIVKEAQEIKNLEELISYVKKPLASTILVICHKHKKYDKRKSLVKAVEETGVYFESARIKEDKMESWIHTRVETAGYKISPKAAVMIADFLGNDLSKVANEITKLSISLPLGSLISEDLVESNIGISKDFNIFELQTALGQRNYLKANRIINYFASNPKDNPLIKNVILLFSFFQKVLIYHALNDKSNKEVASALGVNPYFTGEYHTAARNYPFEKTVQIIGLIREYDLKAKGLESGSATEVDLMKELIYKILH